MPNPYVPKPYPIVFSKPSLIVWLWKGRDSKPSQVYPSLMALLHSTPLVQDTHVSQIDTVHTLPVPETVPHIFVCLSMIETTLSNKLGQNTEVILSTGVPIPVALYEYSIKSWRDWCKKNHCVIIQGGRGGGCGHGGSKPIAKNCGKIAMAYTTLCSLTYPTRGIGPCTTPKNQARPAHSVHPANELRDSYYFRVYALGD